MFSRKAQKTQTISSASVALFHGDETRRVRIPDPPNSCVIIFCGFAALREILFWDCRLLGRATLTHTQDSDTAATVISDNGLLRMFSRKAAKPQSRMRKPRPNIGEDPCVGFSQRGYHFGSPLSPTFPAALVDPNALHRVLRAFGSTRVLHGGTTGGAAPN